MDIFFQEQDNKRFFTKYTLYKFVQTSIEYFQFPVELKQQILSPKIDEIIITDDWKIDIYWVEEDGDSIAYFSIKLFSIWSCIKKTLLYTFP